MADAILDVVTASEQEINQHAIRWIQEQVADEQKAAEMYGKMAGLLEEAARSERHTVGRSDLLTTRERQLWRDASNILGGIATDEMKHQAMLVKLLGEFGGEISKTPIVTLFGASIESEHPLLEAIESYVDIPASRSLLESIRRFLSAKCDTSKTPDTVVGYEIADDPKMPWTCRALGELENELVKLHDGNFYEVADQYRRYEMRLRKSYDEVTVGGLSGKA